MTSGLKMSSAAQPSSTNDSSPSSFALSFERITIESLAASWQDIEALVKQLAEKRGLVEQHTKSAAEHIRCIALVNGEIDCLERKFSSVLAGMVAERTRVQDKLRALVLEWERSSATSFSERAKEVQRCNEEELRRLRDSVDSLTHDRDCKEQQLLSAQQRIKDMELLLGEYGLSCAGPLVESLRARAIIAQMNGASPQQQQQQQLGGLIRSAATTEQQPGAAPTLSAAAAGSSPQQRHPQPNVLHRSSSATAVTSSSFSHQHYVSAADREMVAETERLRQEVTKLQADLAASKVESKMRLDEVKALRGVRDELAMSVGRSGAFESSFGGGKSAGTMSNVSATFASRHEDLFHHRGSTVTTTTATEEQRRGSSYFSANVFGSTNAAYQHQQHQSPTKTASHMSLGLDLGTRRQQAGLRGVHVTDVVDNSSAFHAGIRRNDVLLSVAGRTTNRLEDVAAAVASVKPHSQLTIEYARPSGGLGALSESMKATIQVDGQLEGPHNTRREHFRSP
jgi:hypothetical protein